MRHYTLGLPVMISVHSNGSVTFEVDLTEADDLFDGVPTDENLIPLYDDIDVEVDQMIVSAAAATIGRGFSTTTNPTTQEATP